MLHNGRFGRRTMAERFWKYVPDQPVGECWEWQGRRTKGGYGAFFVDYDNRHAGAHRVAYELLIGPIPEGLHIDHLCRNRGCVNPAHLEPVTFRENLLRGEAMGARWARRTVCHKCGGELTFNPKRVPKGRRECKACNAQWRKDNAERANELRRERSRIARRQRAGLQ